MKKDLGIVFPGQGSQKVGMLAELGQDHSIVGKTFAEASEVLSYDLWELVQNDPGGDLSKTSVTQPALLASSVAVWRIWLEQGGAVPALMAGHSLGEYSALVGAGVLAFTDAVRLVARRGEYMQSAMRQGAGGMAAIVGLDDDTVIDCCDRAAEGQVVEAVNFNSPGQVVIAGDREALERAVALCSKAGAKRAVPLPVSAPFHCALMEPAARRFSGEVEKVAFSAPRIPVMQNASLETSDDPDVIRENLVRQIAAPVPWVATINRFAEIGIATVLELGPGKVLSGLIRRIEPELQTLSVNDPASLKQGLALAWQQD